MTDSAPQGEVRVSAILPVRNPGPDLAGSIEAIRSTLSVDDELIVVDDGVHRRHPGPVA